MRKSTRMTNAASAERHAPSHRTLVQHPWLRYHFILFVTSID
jgi:hypothetical protein